jgi:hypothetical protein
MTMKKSLPFESIADETYRGIVTKFALALLVFLTANLAAWAVLKADPTINVGYSTINWKWNLLYNLEEPVETLIVGDSTALTGVVPDILSETFGGESLNIATIGNSLVIDDAWMIETYIDRYVPPKRVVMSHVYDIWRRDIDSNTLGQIPTRYVWPHLDADYLSFHQRVNIVLGRYLPLYFNDRTVPDLVMKPWRALIFKDPWRALSTTGVGFQTAQNDGFVQRNETDPAVVLERLGAHKRFVSESQYHMSRANRTAFKSIVSLSAEYGFDLYVANGPLFEKLADDVDFRKYYAMLIQDLAMIAIDSDSVHVIADSPFTLPINWIENVDHAVLEGPELYTRWLADTIQRIEDSNGRSR